MSGQTKAPVMELAETTAQERLADALVHFRRQSEELKRANAHVEQLVAACSAFCAPVPAGSIWAENQYLNQLRARSAELVKDHSTDQARERFKNFKRVQMCFFGVSTASPQTPGGLGLPMKIGRDDEEEFAHPAARCSIGINELPEDVHYISVAMKSPELPAVYMALDVKGATELIRALDEARDKIFAHNDRVLG